MKKFILLVVALQGCGSFEKVLDDNKARTTEHRKFQVNRIGMISTCYANATTDTLKHGCQLMQMNLQTEQGFTVADKQTPLPETPEEQIKDGLTEAATLGVGYKLGKEVIDGLNRPNDVVKVPEIYEVEKPTYIKIPADSVIETP